MIFYHGIIIFRNSIEIERENIIWFFFIWQSENESLWSICFQIIRIENGGTKSWWPSKTARIWFKSKYVENFLRCLSSNEHILDESL